MDFFERQDKARRNTKWLVLYFILAIAGITGAVYLVLALSFGDTMGTDGLWSAPLFGWTVLVTLSLISFGSLAKTVALRQGGGAVAMMLGGVPLDRSSQNADDQKLLNIVEEMAIASGMPVPEVYVLEKENGINAFAAGHSLNDAAIGVTRGCATLLSRDELQGVIAHEFSHILNGDMRLNVRLIGLVHGILCIALIGRALMRVRSRGKKNALPLLGFGLFVIGWIGVFFGRLIKSAVSRQREYLADASAVQFTRNPAGLAGALKKIGGYAAGSHIENEHAEEASHLFFGNALNDAWFATHPALEERIRFLDPAFDGKYPRVLSPEAEWEPTTGKGKKVYEIPISGRVPYAGLTSAPVQAVNIVPRIGNPGQAEIRYAADFLQTLPDDLHAAAQEPLSASALCYALLLSPNLGTRAQQLQQIRPLIQDAAFQEATRLYEILRQLPVTFKLPLLSLALPTLAQLSAQQSTELQRGIQLLVDCDKEIDLFEYTLQKVVARHLKAHLQPAPPRAIQFYSLKPLLPDIAVLLSALAHVGNTKPENVHAAFERGAASLGAHDGELRPAHLEACGLPQIDPVLEGLAMASPAIKKRVLDAAAHTVALDGNINPEEAELLRAIAETLECPIPPFVQGI